MYHIFCIHSEANGYLDCFHVLAIVNNAVKTGIHVFILIMAFPGYMPSSGIAGLYGSLFLGFFFFFKESPYCPLWYQFILPGTVQEVSPVSTLSPAFIVCRFFDDGHSDWCELISHCSFDLYFSNNEKSWGFPGSSAGK